MHRVRGLDADAARVVHDALAHQPEVAGRLALLGVCLLYTSDAADERSSVDLGGRRIIKKKKRERNTWTAHSSKIVT